MKKVTYTRKESKEIFKKAERAHEYFMNVESNAAAYHDYMLVVNQSKEYAEKVLGTLLA